MQFPSYVPAAVRKKISRYLEGESDRDIPGYIQLLACAGSHLCELSRAIQSRKDRGEIEYLPNLHKQMADAVQRRDGLARDVDILKRLANDPRMREAFRLLNDEFTNGNQFEGFIFSAWVARADYANYRDRLKRAGELKGEIAKTARALAVLIRRFANTGVDGPDEFWSIPALLRRTDSDDVLWRPLRRQLLGDRPESAGEPGASDVDNAPTIEVRFVAQDDRVKVDHQQQALDTTRYIWHLSPPLPALLESVATAARSFTPRESGMIAAALISRQRSNKTEYLRAFANRLIDSGIAVTTPVMHAMVPAANVVINSSELDVSYDDVRKALRN
jgi:hypothetical protein